MTNRADQNWPSSEVYDLTSGPQTFTIKYENGSQAATKTVEAYSLNGAIKSLGFEPRAFTLARLIEWNCR